MHDDSALQMGTWRGIDWAVLGYVHATQAVGDDPISKDEPIKWLIIFPIFLNGVVISFRHVAKGIATGKFHQGIDRWSRRGGLLDRLGHVAAGALGSVAF